MRAHRWPGLVLVFALAVLAALAAAEPLSAAGEVVIDQPAITIIEYDIDRSPIADALDALGLFYTDRTGNRPAFDVDMASGTYDIAMINAASSDDIGNILGSIRTFLDNGRKVLFFYYAMDNHSADTLWALMGAAFQEDLTVPPSPINKLVPSHPIFTTPNAVGTIAVTTELFTDDGDHVSALSRGVVVATSPGGDPVDGLIVVRRDGRSILNTFLPSDYAGDADMDKLVQNEIAFLVDRIVGEDFEVHPNPFEFVFSPVRCVGCSFDVDYDPGPGSCFCDTQCIGFGDCCYDACQLCGRCQP